jgi:hypothetical protein
VNNPRPKRGVLFTNKKSLVNSLNMLYKPKDLDEDAPHPHLNKTGKLKQWYHDAQDEKYWEWKIDDTLRKPHLDKPPPSNGNTTPPLLKMPMGDPHHLHHAEIKMTFRHRHLEDAVEIEVRTTETLTPPE